jgi:hypothetical protein
VGPVYDTVGDVQIFISDVFVEFCVGPDIVFYCGTISIGTSST